MLISVFPAAHIFGGEATVLIALKLFIFISGSRKPKALKQRQEGRKPEENH